MNRFKKISVTLLMVLAISFSIFFIGNMVGDNTPEASAVLTTDEIDLCKLLNTYIGTDTVDVAGFIECIAAMNDD